MKGRFDSGFSFEDRNTIEDIYKRVMGRAFVRTSCSDCYRDAYIIISNKLRTMAELPKEAPYKLRAGEVLRRFGTNELYTLEMPTEAAEQWLTERPQDITKFQRYPADWQERVESRRTGAKPATDKLPAEEKKTQQAQKKAAKSSRRK